MYRLLKPKNIHRALIGLILLAPIAYLFGTQIGALAGAHGEEVIAEDSASFGAPVNEDYVGNQNDLAFDNGFFGVTSLLGNSVMDGTNVLGAQSSKFSYSFGSSFYDSALPDIVLHSAGDFRDSISFDGVYTRRVNVVSLGSLAWSRDGSTSFFYTMALPRYLDDSYLTTNLTYVAKGSSIPNPIDYFTRSGSGFFEVYCPSASNTDELKEIYNDIYIAYPRTNVLISNVDGFDYRFKSVSPVSIRFDSAVPQAFTFTYWQDVQKVGNYRDDLFNNMFGRSNFLTEWGEDALSENRHGFAPVGELFKYVDDNMLHLSDKQIGKMAYGYMYYVVHVLIFDIVALAFVFVVTIPQKVLNMINDKTGGDL